MKTYKQIWYWLILTLWMINLSCNPEEDLNTKLKGIISINLEVDASMIIEQGRKMEVNTDSFKIIIYTDGGIPVRTFEVYKDIPDEIELDTGNYYVVAHSNNEAAASFENAYYYGESSVFNLSPMELVPVTFTCELFNFLVTVQYTDNVSLYFNDWSTKIWNNEDTLEFVKDEIRQGYFKVAPVSILATLFYSKSDGSEGLITVSGSINDPQRKTQYIITIDGQINSGSVGPIQINIDETTNTVNLFLSNIEETFTDPRDGNIYKTIKIGSQVWMAENLRATQYTDGTPIPLVESASAWDALGLTDKAYSYYDNSTSNGDIYGALYTWAAAMNGAGNSEANPSGVQGVCPVGWHLPSDAEWKELEMFLGMSQTEADKEGERGTDEGNKLKEAGTAHWSSPNGGTNSSGFTALPGGSRGNDGSFSYSGDRGHWWSSSEGPDTTNAWCRRLSYVTSSVSRNPFHQVHGFSVRCLRD